MCYTDILSSNRFLVTNHTVPLVSTFTNTKAIVMVDSDFSSFIPVRRYHCRHILVVTSVLRCGYKCSRRLIYSRGARSDCSKVFRVADVFVMFEIISTFMCQLSQQNKTWTFLIEQWWGDCIASSTSSFPEHINCRGKYVKLLSLEDIWKVRDSTLGECSYLVHRFYKMGYCCEA
jgi:hypothetical protein